MVTNQTSPYQVEFMEAVTRDGGIDLQVIYLHSRRAGRSWSQPVIHHEHVILNGDRGRFVTARKQVEMADLVVFGYYRDPLAYELMQLRARQNRSWCFWGERMGVSRWGWAGAIYRRLKLRQLHRSPAAIWGIGEFALERYRREFGRRRVYCNVPYYSDLSRFAPVKAREYPVAERRILCSGSLIERKGVDVLAKAFLVAARQCPNLRITFLGEGSLQTSLARELKECSDRVTFAGFKDWSELPQYYQAADVLCVPSRHDGWGLVVPEGLAAGLPVIGTNQTGAARELIQPGHNGWLVETGNVTELAQVLELVARLSPEELKNYSSAALAGAANHSLAAGVRRFNEAVSAALNAWR